MKFFVAIPFSAICTLLLLVLVLCSGCKETNPTKTMAEYNATNIQKVRNSYSMYATANGGPPKDLESFVSFFKQDEGAQIRLKRMGIDPAKIDDMLISERDGKPFIIRWGLGGPKDHPVVFEAEGIEGKRMVAYFDPKELSNEECDALLKGNGK